MSLDVQALAEKHGFARPCRGLLRHLATFDPNALLKMCREHTLVPTLLTFAAEYIGEIEGSTDVLIGLLDHPSPIVREGAMLGMPDDNDEAFIAVSSKVEAETSPAVKEVMSEYLATNAPGSD